ncbi:MAG: N-6 DNA methylase [Flavobacteriales bacterium]|nr:N-6 DNA methylase [Flavobacteriales bacterium]
MAPGGRAVVLVGENLLFSSGAASAIRRQLLDQGLLSAVISLPVGVFRYAGIKTSVLLLENKQAGNSDVVFVDAGEYLTTNSPRHKVIDGERLTKALYKGSEVTGVVHASYAAVKKHDSLSMARFQALESTAYSEVERLNEFVPLRKVIKTQLGVRDTIGEAPYFQVSELASDIVDIVRRADSGRKDRPRSARSAKLIEEPALLVARVGGTLKPTIFDPGAGPVAIGSNVFAFRVDEKRVDLRYLALELRSGAVQEQLDAYSSGSGVRAISKADLLQLLVRVPDLATQRRIIEQQYDLGLFMEQIKEGAGPLEQEMDQFVRLIEKNISRLGHSGLRKVLTDWREHERTVAVRLLTNRAKENMKMLRHQFNNRLGWVTTGLGNVSTFIDHLVDEGVIPEDMPIAPSLEGEEAPSPSIVATIEQLHRNAEQLPELFGRLSDSFERSDLNPEYIEMDEFIRTSILPLYENDKRFRLVMGEPRSNSTSAYVDRFAMEQVICNIIDNAVKHGFTDGGKNYHLYIEVEGEMLIIANDGAPPSIDLGEMKIRGRSVGPNAGSGEGMYWADALMQQMGGKLMQMYNAEEYFQAPISFCISMNLPVAS